MPGVKRDTARSSLGDSCNKADRVNQHGGDIQQLVAEAFLQQGKAYFNADLSIQNGGGVRVDVPAGPVTVGTIYTVLPFTNVHVQLKATGTEIKAALEDALDNVAASNGSGPYPYAGGLRWDVDLGKAKGSRLANLQLRGVCPDSYPALINGLRSLGLLDERADVEARRNLLLSPFWTDSDGTPAICEALTLALAAPDAPTLPSKFGFAIDVGTQPVLRAGSADIRIERMGDQVLVYADGATTGACVDAAQAAQTAQAAQRRALNKSIISSSKENSSYSFDAAQRAVEDDLGRRGGHHPHLVLGGRVRHPRRGGRRHP